MINEFRPHQARETLKLILEMQKKRREVTTQNLKEVIAKATEILNEAHSSLQQDWLLRAISHSLKNENFIFYSSFFI